MATPTPVSAYLHSATMVKAGIYLLARLHPVLGGTDAWFHPVTTIRGAIMLVGALLAILQTDLKLILASSTVGLLGTLTMLLTKVGVYSLIRVSTLFFPDSMPRDQQWQVGPVSVALISAAPVTPF